MVILMFVVAMPGYFGHAGSLVEGLGAAVDGELVKDEILAFLPGLADECADEAGTDAAALMIGVDFDTGEVDLGGAVFDVEHADACPPAVMICQRPRLKARAWKSRLLVPPPDRGDVVTHGGLVQMEAELAVGGGGRPHSAQGPSSVSVPLA
jgi:hypothetical protein